MMKRRINTSDRIDCQNGIHLTVLQRSDEESLVKYLNDLEIYQTTGSIPYPYRRSDAERFLASVIAFEQENKIQRDWAIRSPEGEQIGGIGFLFNHGIQSHRSEIGYWLGRPFWNRGIGTDVVTTWSDHMLDQGQFVRLEALVFAGNIGSCRVLEKAGFSEEGFLRKGCKKGNEYKDVHLYAKLKP